MEGTGDSGGAIDRRVQYRQQRKWRGCRVKITDVTLTIFAWTDIPATTYGRHTGRFSGKSHLGLLAIKTDDGVEGHAFLGSPPRGANLDGESLSQFLKPVVMGQNPLDRARLYQGMGQRNRATP